MFHDRAKAATDVAQGGRGWSSGAAGAALFASLTAVGAWLRVPLPWVPVTLQTLFVLLAGLTLTPGWAFASQVVYLAVGLAGFPVFAGTSGLAAAVSPTFGYLLSFPAAAWLVARLSSGGRSFRRDLLAGLAGSAGILLIGAVYLAAATRWLVGQPLGFVRAFTVGAVIFLPGEILKATVAAAVARRLRRAFAAARQVDGYRD